MISFLVIAMSAFLSMRVGMFSVDVVAIALVVVLAAMAVYGKTRGLGASAGKQMDLRLNHQVLTPVNGVLFGLLLAAVLLYALFPTYYLLGGRDPGLYLVFSVHIANTGGLVLDLPVLRDLHATHGDVIRLGFPGIYSAYARGLSGDPAELIPQFMHLFPSIGAIFYQLAGLEGLVRTNAAIAVFALWSFFMVARRLAGPPTALLATLALALNAAFIWNARITLTEVLAVAFLFSGLYLLIRAFDSRSAVWAAASGAILGLALLNRVDSALNVLIILGAVGAAFFRPSDFRPVVLPLMVTYLGFSTWGFVDGYVHTFPYFYDLWMGGSLKGLVYLNYGIPVIAGLAFALRGKIPLKRVEQCSLVEGLLKGAVILLGAWILFAWSLWPVFDDGFNARAIGELAWYVTPVMFAVFLYGLWHAISMKSRNPLVIPLIVMAISVLFLFTWRPTITPDHIWAARRWTPQVIPLLILFAAVGLRVFLDKGGARLARGTAVALVVLYYVGSSLAFASPYLFQSMMADLRTGYDSVVEAIDEVGFRNGVSLSRDNPRDYQTASILTYVYGKKTVLIRDQGVDLLGSGAMDGLLFLGFDEFSSGEWFYRGSLEGRFLEKQRGQKPQSLYFRSYSTNFGRIDTAGPVIFRSVPSGGRFGSRVGVFAKEVGEVQSSGEKGVLLFGPYIPVEPGMYRVIWKGEWVDVLPEPGDVGFVDVVHGKGTEQVASARVVPAELRDGVVGEIEFVLTEAVNDLEYRYHVKDRVHVRISEVMFEEITERGHEGRE
ncbi:ArnT family glycosyltransferase [Thioalkalivibrio paradoxus]|nr:glycosyltransferase family 39 protein [Thioalkalivibrio paradoxus]